MIPQNSKKHIWFGPVFLFINIFLYLIPQTKWADIQFNDVFPLIGELLIHGGFIRPILMTLSGFICSFALEYYQSTKGANKSKAGQSFWSQDWVIDVRFSTQMVAISAVVFELSLLVIKYF